MGCLAYEERIASFADEHWTASLAVPVVVGSLLSLADKLWSLLLLSWCGGGSSESQRTASPRVPVVDVVRVLTPRYRVTDVISAAESRCNYASPYETSRCTDWPNLTVHSFWTVTPVFPDGGFLHWHLVGLRAYSIIESGFGFT